MKIGVIGSATLNFAKRWAGKMTSTGEPAPGNGAKWCTCNKIKSTSQSIGTTREFFYASRPQTPNCRCRHTHGEHEWQQIKRLLHRHQNVALLDLDVTLMKRTHAHAASLLVIVRMSPVLARLHRHLTRPLGRKKSEQYETTISSATTTSTSATTSATATAIYAYLRS